MKQRSKIKVLVACERFGKVRDAFRSRGFDAYSCDTAEYPSIYHYQDDARDVIKYCDWDLVIAHPPCTATCVSGNGTYAGTIDREEGINFFMFFVNETDHVPHVAIEHPVSVISTAYRPPDQYVQPWQFGHGETKKTGLWLKNLPCLTPTNIVEGREQRVWKMSPSKDRPALRSMTYDGIAEAMADQWGRYIEAQDQT